MNTPEIAGLLDYLKKSPTCFHAIDAACEILRANGFAQLEECENWSLKPASRYFTTRNRSSIIAFVTPEAMCAGFQIVASHSDSPTFKVKENAELVMQDKYVRLDVERYGGAILSSWFDRPLSVAGRVMVRDGQELTTKLVNIDRDSVMIPNVAIHMNREVNNGYKYNAACDTMPLWSDGMGNGSFKKAIAKEAGVQEKDVIGADLFLYNRMPGTVWGEQDEFVSAGRLDDLECAYASLCAITEAKHGHKHVSVCCIFDNEEVGSGTKQGANSTFLSDVLRRIVIANGGSEEDYCRMLTSSFMLSADNAHATHPNHPEYADPINQVQMNRGIVIKSNANQKYTTDAVSQAVFSMICEKASIPVQYFANRSDLAGGSTLGNISGSHVSVNTVDIGLAQLAMHSCYETAGTKDLGFMIGGMKAFYSTEIQTRGDGDYTLASNVYT